MHAAHVRGAAIAEHVVEEVAVAAADGLAGIGGIAVAG